ncbi:hypothetical protein JXB28_00340 [Candidatus Woesearchaeota archaeon]|nr:hypothetical protein [Candidatus Woesearchaeota archaeon]
MCKVSIKEKLRHRIRLFLCQKHKQQKADQEKRQSLKELRAQARKA